MKTLYESILDDEEVLINDLKKNIDNPFYFVSTLMSTNSNLLEYKSEIIRLFDNFIKSFNSYEPIKVFIYQSCIKIKYTHDHVEPIITLKPVDSRDNRMHFGVSSRANMLILFSDEHLHSLSDYGFDNPKQFYSWIKDISKKYNFKESKKDALVYYTL